MKLSDFVIYNGPVSRAERAAGIIKKLYKNRFTKFWFCVVKLKSIQFDTHQRPVDRKHVEKLTTNFQPLFFEEPICTYRGDGRNPSFTLYCEEGRQRLEALGRSKCCDELDGEKVVVVKVHFECDRSKAAQLFSVINGSKKRMSPWTEFIAACNGGGEVERKVLSLSEKFGWIKPNQISKSHPILKHVKEYCNIFKKDGTGELLSDFFYLYAKLFKNQKCDVGFVRGFVAFLEQRNIARSEYVRRLKELTVKQIVASAKDGDSVRADKSQIQKAFNHYFLVRGWQLQSAA